MKLIVGLGNSGKRYLLTRHNIGFLVIDYLANFLGLQLTAGKGHWYGAAMKVQDVECYLMKPTTYMNDSGQAISEFLLLHQVPLKDILIICDDFNLPLGTIRLRAKGSDGGHNGIRSIIGHLESLNFPRMRIGIGKTEVLKKEDYVDFVLSNFSNEELDILKKLMPIFKDCVLSFIVSDIATTMNKFNKNFIDQINT
ncbi:MAG: aminoacyl-tRNA hydrolase [Ignavibacteria bacterium]